MKSGLELLLWLPSIWSTPTVSTIDWKSPSSKFCLWSNIVSGCMLYLHRLCSQSLVLSRSQHVFMIPLGAYRSVFFEDLICYLYHGCIGVARTPLLEIICQIRLCVWIYKRLIVECLHVASLLSLESAILVDSLSFENTYWLFLCFYLFLSWLKANMFLN